MRPHKLFKEISETYFAEKDTVWSRSKRWWSFLFLLFFSLYLFQIYAAFMDWQPASNPMSFSETKDFDINIFWRTKVDALIIQGIVLFGIFVKFLTSQFRGRWFLRFGELGEVIAFAAFYKHYVWTNEVLSNLGNVYCGSPSLFGMTPFVSQWLGLFFFCWFIYKILWIIAVTWKTVRK